MCRWQWLWFCIVRSRSYLSSPVHELVLQPGSLPAVWGPQQLLWQNLPPSGPLKVTGFFFKEDCPASHQCKALWSKEYQAANHCVVKNLGQGAAMWACSGMFNMSSTKCHLIWKTHWQGFTGNIKDSGSAKFPFMPSLGNDSPLHPSSTRCHLGLIEAYQLFLPLWHENDTVCDMTATADKNLCIQIWQWFAKTKNNTTKYNEHEH